MLVKCRRIMQRNSDGDFHKTLPLSLAMLAGFPPALYKSLKENTSSARAFRVQPDYLCCPWNLLRSRFLPGPVVQLGRVRGAVLSGVGVPLPPRSGLCLGLPAGRAGQHRCTGSAQVHRALRSVAALCCMYWMWVFHCALYSCFFDPVQASWQPWRGRRLCWLQRASSTTPGVCVWTARPRWGSTWRRF